MDALRMNQIQELVKTVYNSKLKAYIDVNKKKKTLTGINNGLKINNKTYMNKSGLNKALQEIFMENTK